MQVDGPVKIGVSRVCDLKVGDCFTYFDEGFPMRRVIGFVTSGKNLFVLIERTYIDSYKNHHVADPPSTLGAKSQQFVTLWTGNAREKPLTRRAS